MADGAMKLADEAKARAYSLPLEEFNPGDPDLFRTDTHWPYFERLRREDPVHWCKDSEFGPYWSVTKFNDIMAVDTNHGTFSSEAALGGITIRDARPDLLLATGDLSLDGADSDADLAAAWARHAAIGV